MENKVRQAIGAIEQALMALADGEDSPPDVEFDFSWIDCRTVGAAKWVPRLAIRARQTTVVHLDEI